MAEGRLDEQIPIDVPAAAELLTLAPERAQHPAQQPGQAQPPDPAHGPRHVRRDAAGQQRPRDHRAEREDAHNQDETGQFEPPGEDPRPGGTGGGLVRAGVLRRLAGADTEGEDAGRDMAVDGGEDAPDEGVRAGGQSRRFREGDGNDVVSRGVCRHRPDGHGCAGGGQE